MSFRLTPETMQAAMQGRLTTTDLACRRGDRVLFRELSLSLGGGAALHITGANGVGKSSLLRLLAGLLRPYAGSVATDGAIALMDERPALDPNMPLGRALSFRSEERRVGEGCVRTCRSRWSPD